MKQIVLLMILEVFSVWWIGKILLIVRRLRILNVLRIGRRKLTMLRIDAVVIRLGLLLEKVGIIVSYERLVGLSS